MAKFKANSYQLVVMFFLLLLLFSRTVWAEDWASEKFSLSGFGTVGVVYSSEDQADFTNSSFKPNGAGYTRRWSADVDSLAGIQLSAEFTSHWSAVAQMIAKQRYDNSYLPEFEWLNVKYAFSPDVFVRAGRVVLPSFMVSDFSNVGYANPWVRPPVEVYNLVPITKSDGLDASYRYYAHEVTNTTQAVYGELTRGYPDGGKVKGKNQWGVFNTTEFASLTVRLGFYRNHTTVESVSTLLDAFRQFGSEGAAIADKYDCKGSRVSLSSFGISYNPGDWFLMGEFTRRDSDCFIGISNAWYISGGYRLKSYVPYVTFSSVRADSPTSDSGLTLSTLPPYLSDSAAILNTELNDILNATPRQQTYSIGIRWNFMRNTDVKVQFDHTRLGSASSGVLINTQPAFQPGGSFNVFSAAIDFVF
jgi:hypothetical protein